MGTFVIYLFGRRVFVFQWLIRATSSVLSESWARLQCNTSRQWLLIKIHPQKSLGSATDGPRLLWLVSDKQENILAQIDLYQRIKGRIREPLTALTALAKAVILNYFILNCTSFQTWWKPKKKKKDCAQMLSVYTNKGENLDQVKILSHCQAFIEASGG